MQPRAAGKTTTSEELIQHALEAGVRVSQGTLEGGTRDLVLVRLRLFDDPLTRVESRRAGDVVTLKAPRWLLEGRLTEALGTGAEVEAGSGEPCRQWMWFVEDRKK